MKNLCFYPKSKVLIKHKSHSVKEGLC